MTPEIAKAPAQDKMQVGQIYKGSLPQPESMKDASAKPASTTPSAAKTNQWNDALHYVAAGGLAKQASSVLLMPGSGLVDPSWVPCGTKPVAVLIALDAVADGRHLDYVRSLEIIGIKPLYLSTAGLDMVSHQLATARRGEEAETPGKAELFVGESKRALRADIGSKYCVVAIIGSRADDFPNSTLPSAPNASPGWFLVGAP